MFGIDEAIAEIGADGGVVLALIVALLLGVRHATDPDHLTAVSALILSEDQRGPRRAGALGLAWGTGHGCTLFVVGLPIVLFGSYLPGGLQRALEAAIGLLILGLGARLLLRWRRGCFHAHVHAHEDVVHAHPHMHESAPTGVHAHPHMHESEPAGPHAPPVVHRHSHAEGLGRSPRAAFAIGLVHGAGGSAGVGVLLVAAMPGQAAALAALAVLSVGTAISMAAVSSGFGYALARGPLVRRFEHAAPVFGTLSMAFGTWYALGALEAVPYAF